MAASSRHLHGPKAFDKLNGRQRTALHDAARVALPATLAIQQVEERKVRGTSAAAACNSSRRQSRPGGAAPRGPARLRPARARRADQGRDRADPSHAVQPLTPGRAGMLQPGSEQAGGKGHADRRRLPLDTTPEDLRARRARLGRDQPEKLRHFRMVLDRGRFTQHRPAGGSAAGGILLARRRRADVPQLATARQTSRTGWSLYRDQLTMRKTGEGPTSSRRTAWRSTGGATSAGDAP